MSNSFRVVVKIAVVGDAGVGKTSIISTAANDTFDARPAPVLPPTRLPAESTPDHVPMVVTDTSSRPEDQQVVDLVIQQSDVVVVCFDATRQLTLDNIRTHWYTRIQTLNPGVPVIMACCKADRLVEEREVNTLRERVEQAVHDLSHVEVCLNCSAKTLRMVADVFFYALKSVLYPLQPLYDRLEKRLRPLCVRALKRVFIMCDEDGDGALKDSELNAFQLACFGMALDPEELQNVKQIVASKMPAGVSARGVTLDGFLFLHVLFIERGRLESTWAVLRKFGYNDQVLLSDEVLDRVSFTLAPDSVWELSDAALDFLLRKFESVDEDRDRLISWQQLDAMFSTIPPPAWQGEFWSHLLVPGMSGSAHNLEAFLLKWQVHALVDPRFAYANLLYLGYGGPDGAGGPALLARGTRRRNDKRHRVELAARTTLQCLVFGPKGSGKTSLLRALIGMRPDGPPTAAPTGVLAIANGTPDLLQGTNTAVVAGGEGVAVVHNVPSGAGVGVHDDGTKGSGSADANWTSVALVKGPDDKERTLVLHEIGSDLEHQILSSAALAAHGAPPLLVASSSAPPPLDLTQCDVAAFVFDSSSPASFRQALELMVQVSTYGGDSLPCVLVATKDELVMSATLEQAVASALSDLQLSSCVRTSAVMGEMNGLFGTLVSASINPEGWIPETPARKAQRRFIRQAVAGVTAGVLTAGLVYCTYCFWSSSSSSSTSSASTTPPPASTSQAVSSSQGTSRSWGTGGTATATAQSAPLQPDEGGIPSTISSFFNKSMSSNTDSIGSSGGSGGEVAEGGWSFPAALSSFFQMAASGSEAGTVAVGSAVMTGSGKGGAPTSVKAYSVCEVGTRSGSGCAGDVDGVSMATGTGEREGKLQAGAGSGWRWLSAAAVLALPLTQLYLEG